MSLDPGARLGPYEIVAFVGQGGMGEVYRARDTRLDRTVALKILPAPVAADPDRRLRFEREARAIASLSHPHVCALHDVGDGYLVMEFLDGETLAERLHRGPLPLAEVVRFGSEMAAALDAAHRQRIVHRDLKPANVMITRSGVKLLDFGLAKALAPQTPGQSILSTMSIAGTTPGTLLGTLPYMAPEQIEGREADARTDIFALGAVLYEMAIGRRAFAGDTAASLASAILAAEPPPVALSPSLDAVIRGCLRKDPDDRWQSAHDVALQLRDVVERDRALARQTTFRSSRLPWLVAVAALVAAVAGVAWAWRARSSSPPGSSPATLAFSVQLPGPDGYVPADVERLPFAIANDGRIALAAGLGDGPTAIWVRAPGYETPTRIPDTEGANSLFWSPDGKTIAFFAAGKLKRVDLAGGAPTAICDVRRGIGQTGSWGDGQMLFASVEGEAIFRVPAAGGAAVAVVRPDRAKGEVRTVWPSFLPDGRRFLYLTVRGDNSGAIMLAGADGTTREVLRVKSNARYVAPGFLVYGEDGALVARRFDPDSGETSGGPISVAPKASYFSSTGLTQFAAADNGTIVYRAGANLGRIAVFDRRGHELSVLRGPDQYQGLRLSADGRDLYVDRRHAEDGSLDIWRIELDRNAETRVTTGPGSEIEASVLGDGSMIFSATRGGPPRLMLRPPTGPDVPLMPGEVGLQSGNDVSPDGKWVIYEQRVARGNYDLLAVSLADRRVVAFQRSDAGEQRGRFSPDGRFVLFESDMTGRPAVHVAPFPEGRPIGVVSTTAARFGRWSRDGREVFYIAEDGTVFAVPIATTPSLRIGKAAALFTRGPRARWSDFAVTADGRFVALEPTAYAAEQPLHVVLNWSYTPRVP